MITQEKIYFPNKNYQKSLTVIYYRIKYNYHIKVINKEEY